MIRHDPLVSVVIATYNSARLLPMAVGALRRQTYPADRIEVLAVDGGSTDRTRELARELGCQVIDNPMTEPVHAKYLGFMAAKGKYIAFLDHDEEIVNPEAIAELVETFRRHPGVRTVDSSGYLNPEGYPIVNEYINEFGEPFSFFMYRQSRGMGFHLPAVARKARRAADDELATVFSPSPANDGLFIENLAACVMTDLEFVKSRIEINQPQDLCHLFFLLNRAGAEFAVAKRNPLKHYSGDTWGKFLAKIRWRVKNNIHHLDQVGAAGFHGRQAFQPPGLKLKKFLFLPYAFSIVLPLADAVWLAATRRQALYLAHPALALYTAWQIVYHIGLRCLGRSPGMKSYDEKQLIKRPGNEG